MTIKIISEDIVFANFETFPTFKEGDLPISDSEARITIDNRVVARAWRRKLGAFGEYGTSCIENTFKRAIQMIEASCSPEKRKEFEVQTSDAKCLKLFENFMTVLGGVERLSKTYEKKDLDISKTLSNISSANKVEYVRLAKLINPQKEETYRGSSSPSSKSPPASSDEVRIVLYDPEGILEEYEAEPDSPEIASPKSPVMDSSSSSDDLLRETSSPEVWASPEAAPAPAETPSVIAPSPLPSSRKAPPKPAFPPPTTPPGPYVMEYLESNLRRRNVQHKADPRSVVHTIDDMEDDIEEGTLKVKGQCLNCVIS